LGHGLGIDLGPPYDGAWMTHRDCQAEQGGIEERLQYLVATISADIWIRRPSRVRKDSEHPPGPLENWWGMVSSDRPCCSPLADPPDNSGACALPAFGQGTALIADT